jgi:hypothetical protein
VSRLAAALAALGCIGVLFAAAAFAGGGLTIASAPTLRIGENVTGGGDDGGHASEWWKVPLAPADRLTVNWGDLSENPACASLWSPRVTDYNVSSSNQLVGNTTYGKSQIVYRAPSAGVYRLHVSGCGDTPWSYEMTAHVQHYTSTTLVAPREVRAGSTAVYRGRVTGVGVAGRTTKLQLKAGGGWRDIATAAVGGNGVYAARAVLSQPGSAKIRALFPGSTAFRPSSATATVRVLG